MATLRPFRALRPSSEKVADVSSVPYDVVSTEEARRLAAGNPLSFLHVSRAEIDLPDGTDPYSDAVYAKAAENLARLRREAPLSPEAEPSLFVYRLRMAGRDQTGVAGVFSLDEYDSDAIRKHERTRRDKAKPLFDFTAPGGIIHTVWRIGGPAAGRLAEQFRPVPLLYIADGHHRAASAARARRELQSKNRRHTGDEPYNFFLAVAFPAGQVSILPYNRVVKDLNGKTPEEFLAALKEKFSVTESASSSPPRKGEVGVYLAGRWYGLLIPPGGVATGGAIGSLDAALLQEKVLEPLLGVRDIRTDKRIDFVGGIRGTWELERLVDSGKFAVAFSLFPVSVEDLIAVSDANEIMPPKSTWFEPKLRDGLLIHEI